MVGVGNRDGKKCGIFIVYFEMEVVLGERLFRHSSDCEEELLIRSLIMDEDFAIGLARPLGLETDSHCLSLSLLHHQLTHHYFLSFFETQPPVLVLKDTYFDLPILAGSIIQRDRLGQGLAGSCGHD